MTKSNFCRRQRAPQAGRLNTKGAHPAGRLRRLSSTGDAGRYDDASPPSAGAASPAAASAADNSFGLTRSGGGSGWPKSLALILFRSVATRSLGVAPTDIQYATRSMLSFTRSDFTFTLGSYVPSSSIGRPSRDFWRSITQIRKKG